MPQTHIYLDKEEDEIIINYSKKALEKYYPTLELLSEIEGLKEHLNSVKARLS